MTLTLMHDISSTTCIVKRVQGLGGATTEVVFCGGNYVQLKTHCSEQSFIHTTIRPRIFFQCRLLPSNT